MAIMCFLAIAIAYVMRVCLSVAITQMVVAVNTTTTGSTKGICLADPPKNDSEKPVNLINSVEFQTKETNIRHRIIVYST